MTEVSAVEALETWFWVELLVADSEETAVSELPEWESPVCETEDPVRLCRWPVFCILALVLCDDLFADDLAIPPSSISTSSE